MELSRQKTTFGFAAPKSRSFSSARRGAGAPAAAAMADHSRILFCR